MLNYLWGAMIIFSMLMALFGGHMQQMTQSILNSSQSAVEICISSCGALAMWMGVMRIAENAHLIDALANLVTILPVNILPQIL